MKETILDLHARSMRESLFFSSIPEHITDDTEKLLQDFMKLQLKLPADTVNNITFHRVHCIGQKNTANNRPCPIVAKFKHFKQKELVKQQGKHLKGSHYGLNDQYPREIMDRCKKLFPIHKQIILKGKKAVISVDKLHSYTAARTSPPAYTSSPSPLI